VAELAARENGCCSFFTFTLTVADGVMTPQVQSPTGTRPCWTRCSSAPRMPRSQQAGPGEGRGSHHPPGAAGRARVAEQAGVNIQTLRYYERRGLIDEPGRSPGGHRAYPPETVTVLRVIKAAQRLGFTLREVAELLEAARHHHRPGPRRGHAETRLAERAG
jgi:hypothetical protein